MVLTASPASAGVVGPDQEPAHEAEIDQQVLDELAGGGTTTSFWVHLADRPDLSGAATAGDRVEQGWFVYDTLTATADASQAGLLGMLDAAGAEHRSFWISSTVQVTGDALG